MEDLVRRLTSLAGEERARIVGVRVRLGALSHFTPEHFREHFHDAVRGTPAEGAVVDAVLSDDPHEPNAQGVLLESVDVEELPDHLVTDDGRP
jgi:hydrogenase nickel incorporation protein HypA/HybF